MKHIIIIEPDVPEDKRVEGLAVCKALYTGKCNICPYLKLCEKGFKNDEFPRDAACMKILNDLKRNSH